MLIVSDMNNIKTIKKHLESDNKSVRLKTIKLIMNHPDATNMDIVECLCSPDNRNFEFLNVFELDKAMKTARKRLEGINDEEVLDFLSDFYNQDPKSNLGLVTHILRIINTKKSNTHLDNLKK